MAAVTPTPGSLTNTRKRGGGSGGKPPRKPIPEAHKGHYIEGEYDVKKQGKLPILSARCLLTPALLVQALVVWDKDEVRKLRRGIIDMQKRGKGGSSEIMVFGDEGDNNLRIANELDYTKSKRKQGAVRLAHSSQLLGLLIQAAKGAAAHTEQGRYFRCINARGKLSPQFQSCKTLITKDGKPVARGACGNCNMTGHPNYCSFHKGKGFSSCLLLESC